MATYQNNRSGIVLNLLFCAILSCVFFVSSPSLAETFGKLKGVTYGSGNNAVVVVLHGDVSRGGPANYHYSFAKSISKTKGTTAIALLRPGYSDGKQASKGNHNNRRDHYTKGNNDMVAKALLDIKKNTKARKFIVVGHSGGAAQLGVIIGRYPGIADSAVLVSGPFNIPRWRTARNSNWPMSQSPHKFLKKIPKSTRIIAITGANDRNTSPKLAEEYIANAQSLGLAAEFYPVSGAGHGFSKLKPRTTAIVKKEIKR